MTKMFPLASKKFHELAKQIFQIRIDSAMPNDVCVPETSGSSSSDSTVSKTPSAGGSDVAVASSGTSEELKCGEIATEVIAKKAKTSNKLLHIGCGPECDCKAAKQKRKRAEAVPEDEKSKTTEPMKKISFDYLDSCSNNGVYDERYGLVIQDEGSEAEFFFPTRNRHESGVVLGIKQFCGTRRKETEEFYSDNAKEFKSAAKSLDKPNPI